MFFRPLLALTFLFIGSLLSFPVQAATVKRPVCRSSAVTILPKKELPLTRLFTGFIGNASVTVKLAPAATGNYFSGTYFYGKQKPCLYLDHESLSTDGEQLTLKESDEKGHVSGTWAINYEKGIITGTWTGPGGKTSRIELVETANTLKDGGRLNATYQRSDKQATLHLVLIEKDTVFYYGDAQWNSGVPGGINVGETTGVIPLSDLTKPLSPSFADDHANDEECAIAISKTGDRLEVVDNNNCGGMNVTFTGSYRKRN